MSAYANEHSSGRGKSQGRMAKIPNFPQIYRDSRTPQENAAVRARASLSFVAFASTCILFEALRRIL